MVQSGQRARLLAEALAILTAQPLQSYKTVVGHLEELMPIAKSIQVMAKKLRDERTRREAKIVAATNNHFRGQTAANAIDLKGLLGVKDNPVPDELAKTYPGLERWKVRSAA